MMVGMAGAYLVVRIKGQADVPHWASRTLELLRLEKKFRATIVPARENTLGMLNKVKHYVAWKETSTEMVRDLLDKRGHTTGYHKISAENMPEGYDTIDKLAESLASGSVSMGSVGKLKPWFALSPPRHGFKRSTKRMHTQQGTLGHNVDLDELVGRMTG